MRHKIDFGQIPLKNTFLHQIEEKEGKIFLVGGACRDLLLGRQPCDYDFLVVGLTEDEFTELFPGAKKVGKKSPVFKLNGHDFSLPGRFSDFASGKNKYKGITKKLTQQNNLPEKDQNEEQNKYWEIVRQDLYHRDFTINALAAELPAGKIIDPLNAVRDLQKRRIVPLSGSLVNDPLRIYRAVRLVCELSTSDREFKLGPVNSQVRAIKPALAEMARERVFEELRRALNSSHPQLFFQLLKRIGVLEIHFAELTELMGNHLRKVLKISTQVTEREEVRFAVLVHDLGKNHVQSGEKLLKKLCSRLSLPNDWEKSGLVAIKHHLTAAHWWKQEPKKLLDMLEEVKKSPLGVEGLEKVIICDSLALERQNKDDEAKIKEKSPEIGLTEFARLLYRKVDSSCLEDIPEGPEFGKALYEMRQEWVTNRLNEININQVDI